MTSTYERPTPGSGAVIAGFCLAQRTVAGIVMGMARTTVSDTDRALLSAVAAQGLRCSAYQLERWRTQRLLPRNNRTFPGQGGSRSQGHPHATDVAVALAAAARRGRPPQELALVLFAAGLSVPDELLVEAVGWAAGQLCAQTAVFAEAAAQAVAALPAGTERFGDDLEVAEEIARQVIASNLTWVRSARRHIRAQRPSLARDELNAELFSAASQLAKFAIAGVLDDANGEGTVALAVADEELIFASGLGAVADQAAGVAEVLPSVTPHALFRAAALLTPSEAPALREMRRALLDLAAQVANGQTDVPAGTSIADPGDPQAFALLVLTALVLAVLREPEASPAGTLPPSTCTPSGTMAH